MPGSPPADEEPERFDLGALADHPAELSLSRLPVGRHGLSREVVARSQRLRIIGAMLHLLPVNGYAETTIGHLTGDAGVSRAAFYEQFEGKEQCFLATYDLAAEWLCARVEETVTREEEWSSRISMGMSRALRLLAANPDLAHLVAVEALQAGPHARRRRQACIDRLAEALRVGRPRDLELPADLEELLVGGAFAHVARYVDAGDSERLPEATQELLQYLLIPYMDPIESRRIADEAA
jgi:AcrR family transcriptional regulator